MPIQVLSSELISEIASAYPQLATLNLSNNEIRRIENLEQLTSLATLNLSHNQIDELGGFAAGHGQLLRELDVTGNAIVTISAAPGGLEVLLLGDNRISDWKQVEAIGALCPDLQHLVLDGNPLNDAEDYRSSVVRIIPTLTELDFSTVSDAERGILSLSTEGPLRSPRSAAAMSEDDRAGGGDEGDDDALRDLGPFGLDQSDYQMHDALLQTQQIEIDVQAMPAPIGSVDLQEEVPGDDNVIEDLDYHASLLSVEENVRLLQQIDILEAENVQLVQRNETLQVQIDMAEEKATDNLVKNSQLESEKLLLAEEVAQERHQRRQEIDSSEQLIDALNQESHSLLDQIARTKSAQEEATLASADTILGLSNQLEAAQQLNQNQHRQNLARADVVADGEAAVSNLGDEIKILRLNLETSQQMVTHLRAERDKLSASNDSLRTSFETEQSSAANAIRQSTELHNQADVLRRHLETSENEVIGVQQTLAGLQNDLALANRALEDSNVELMRCAGLEEENALLQRKLGDSEQHSQAMQNALAATKADVDNAAAALANSKAEMMRSAGLEEANTLLRRKLDESEQQAQGMQAALAASRADVDVAAAALVESKTFAADRTSEIASAKQEELVDAYAAIQNLSAERDQKVKQLESLIERQSADITALRVSLHGRVVDAALPALQSIEQLLDGTGKLDQLVLLSMRIKSMENVMAMQERGIGDEAASGSAAEKRQAGQALLTQWRHKVIQLMVQSETDKLTRTAAAREATGKQTELQKQVEELRYTVGILENSNSAVQVDLRKQRDLLQQEKNGKLRAQQLHQSTQDKLTNADDRLASLRRQLEQAATAEAAYMAEAGVEAARAERELEAARVASKAAEEAGRLAVLSAAGTRVKEVHGLENERDVLAGQMQSMSVENDRLNKALVETRGSLAAVQEDLVDARGDLRRLKKEADTQVEGFRGEQLSKVREAQQAADEAQLSFKLEAQRMNKEHSKSISSLKALEAQVKRSAAEHSTKALSRVEELEKQLQSRDAAVKGLREERNALMSTMRAIEQRNAPPSASSRRQSRSRKAPSSKQRSSAEERAARRPRPRGGAPTTAPSGPGPGGAARDATAGWWRDGPGIGAAAASEVGIAAAMLLDSSSSSYSEDDGGGSESSYSSESSDEPLSYAAARLDPYTSSSDSDMGSECSGYSDGCGDTQSPFRTRLDRLATLTSDLLAD